LGIGAVVDSSAKTVKGLKAQTPADWRALSLWFFKGIYTIESFVPVFRILKQIDVNPYQSVTSQALFVVSIRIRRRKMERNPTPFLS
jgi:hypothetical protein